jgi:PAS domain S-box-containing protein
MPFRHISRPVRVVPGPAEQRHAALRALGSACAAVTTLIGMVGFATWFMDAGRREALFPRGITIKTNTSLALMAGGIAALLLARTPRSAARTRAARIASAFVFTVGVLTMTQHVSGWDLGIDQLLFRESPGALATHRPNRMGPPAALAFTLIGAALLLADARSVAARRVAEVFTLFTGLLATVALLGYVYEVPVLFGVSRYTGIALHTALAIALLAAAALCARPERGMLRQLTTEDSGGALARRLLPPALVLPVVLAWVQQSGERRGLYGSDFGESMLVLATMITFSLFVVWTSTAVSRQARARGAAEAAQGELRDRLVRILENIAQGFFAFDGSGRCTYVNRHAERLAGQSRQRLLGQPLEAVLSHPDLHAAVERALTTGAIAHAETHDPGAGAWHEHDVVPTTEGVTVFTRDVTDSRRIQEERLTLLQRERSAREAAEHSNRMKDEFLATLSHELRTPLNSILGWASVLTRGASEADARRGLEAIERNATLQARLIEDLLDMSRIVSGKVQLDVGDVDLALVIENVLATIAPAAAARGIHVSRALADRDVRVRGDGARLQQVIWNLASNAAKFTPSGGRVHVSLAREQGAVVVRVTDTGIGIRPEFLPQVFDRFRQADASSTRSYGGLGLGLSIARHLTELHGGTLTAESPGEGQGATFTLRLPLSPTIEAIESDGASRNPQSLPDPDSEAGHLHGLRVLVVDDEADARDLLQRVLSERGAEVVAAEGVGPALRHLDAARFDVLVSDIAMPEADGYALIRQVRVRHGALPALALTAFARAEDRDRALEAGYHAHLSKPVTPARLAEAIRRLAGENGAR